MTAGPNARLQARRRQAVTEAVAAYDADAIRLLRDLADELGATVAYVDRATVEAHLDRVLSAVAGQFRGMDFDEHVGDHGTFRTGWIETVLERAGVPGAGYSSDGGAAG